MSRIFIAGAVYFGTVFSLGFALGTVRLFVLEPRVGLRTATLIELPFMLAASWLLCSWVMKRWHVPQEILVRTLIGAVTFGLLLIAEIIIGLTLLGRNLLEQLHAMTSGAGALGLTAQLLFASFPAVQLRWERRT